MSQIPKCKEFRVGILVSTLGLHLQGLDWPYTSISRIIEGHGGVM